jgi:hypothetical protein
MHALRDCSNASKQILEVLAPSMRFPHFSVLFVKHDLFCSLLVRVCQCRDLRFGLQLVEIDMFLVFQGHYYVFPSFVGSLNVVQEEFLILLILNCLCCNWAFFAFGLVVCVFTEVLLWL